MTVSALMLLNQRGEMVIFRAYRDDVSRGTAEAFRSQVVARLEASTREPVKLLDGTNFLCTRRNNMYFTALTRSNVNPALVFEFLFQLARIFAAYLGDGFTEDDIRNNFTLIYELLDETMDFGHPQSCSVDVLKLYINLGHLQPESAEKSSQLTAQITGAIDWRQPGIKHRTNEVYIAIREEAALLISADGTVLSSEVTGQIKMKAFLSGMPDCKLGLNDKIILESKGTALTTGARKRRSASMRKARAVDIADCTFHRCVSLGKFDADRTITFIPPDGEFELMKYRITDNVQIPFRVLPVVEEVGKTRVVYNLRLVAEFDGKVATGIVVKVPVPTNATRAQPQVSKGRAKYDPAQHAIVWRIRKMHAGSEATFSCTVERMPSTREKPWARPPVQLDFVAPMYTASGLSVRFLKVVDKSGYSVDKWVKYATKAGNYQIRI